MIVDNKSEKQWNRIFINKKLAIKVIMDCRTTSADKFIRRSWFKQSGVILTKKKLLLTKIMISFERQNMQTQQSLPSYRIELYFHDYKVAIEIDENGHSDRKIDYKIKDKKK